MKLDKVVTFLDRELKLSAYTDGSNNGLQVANGGAVTRVCCGVDASLPFFEAAAAAGANLLICHHGLSWGDSLKHITGLNYRLIRFLIEHDMALWACHLPLDAHAKLGNNACIARGLGLRKLEPFCSYHGQMIGWRGELPLALSRARFHALVRRVIAANLQTMDFGPAAIRRVGIVSGSAAAEVAQAAGAGLDVYVSGEPTLQGYNLACQLGMNAVFAGHYASERFGVIAVGELLRRHFKLPSQFVDLHVTY